MKLLLLLLFIGPACFAQPGNNNLLPVEINTGNKITMAAGSRFSASGWKQFWWGRHWRKEWLIPVEFPVIDLDTTASGLTPKKEGGGKETKSLRVLGATGKEYVLRTIDKNPDVLVPEEYKGSFVQAVVEDQICTAHPYSSLVVAKLSEGIGILHTDPLIVFVPDNPRLGEFKPDFAGKLCLFEQRPNGEGWKNTSLTGYASDIINTDKLLEKLDADNTRKVDQKTFLKIRLFDMVINDWDRHSDQWLWAAEKKEGKTIYHPFARDRDQAFSKTDGVNMFLLTRPWALRHLQNMNEKVTDVIGSTQSGVFMDKKFLNELTEQDWKQTIADLQKLLTDELIANALQQLPSAIDTLSAAFLFKRLQSRRNDLPRFGMRYYHILNKQVDITGSDKDETFIINRNNDHTTEITVQAKDKNNLAGDTIFHRVFDPHSTKQINLYAMSGNDTFIFQGKTNNKTRVRSFGNDGHDAFINQQDSGSIVKRNSIYDGPADKTIETKGLNYTVVSDTAVTNYHWDEFRYDWWMPLLVPGYNPDDGIVIGAGIVYKRQQWNKHPFGWEQTFTGNYAASTGAFSLFYKGIFTHAIGKWDFDPQADYKAPSYVINFYGFGNDSKLGDNKKVFYRARAQSLFINPNISRRWDHHSFTAGILFNSVKVQNASNKFISHSIAGIDSSVFTTKYFAGAKMQYAFNTADSLRYPTRGIDFHAGADYRINLQQASRDYIKLHASFTFYYTPFHNVTIAHRTGAAINKGQFEFYQANTLGGFENLRGYWRSRFTGQGSFYQNTDIRLKLGTLNGYVFRGTVGIYGFFDNGRVWVKDDHSNELHTGYGGGFYFLPFNALAINMYYASSKEVNTFVIRTGFLF